jgi:hypothetical protein
MEILPYYLDYKLHDKGVTEVLFLCIHNMPWLRQLHFRNWTQTKIFQRWNSRSCILQQTWLLTKPCWFYQRTFKDMITIIFYFPTEFRTSHSKTDITKSHCKIDGSCCNTPSPAHEFCYRHQCYETTKQVVKLLGIPEGKYSQTFQSRLAGDKVN